MAQLGRGPFFPATRLTKPYMVLMSLAHQKKPRSGALTLATFAGVLSPLQLLLVLLLAVSDTSRIYVEAGSGCVLRVQPESSGFVSNDCTWTAAAAISVSTGASVSVLGDRHPVVGGSRNVTKGALITVRAPETWPPTAPSTDVGLSLTRLVLVGFRLSSPGSTKPLLWPDQLAFTNGGGRLSMTDVRLVISDTEVFVKLVAFFSGAGIANYWTDNVSFLHVHGFNDSRTTLHSVGVLLQAPPSTPNPVNLPWPLVKDCVMATNATLVPSLLTFAGATTSQPLLVYVDANVSLGASVVIRRPVVFIGLQSLLTSVDLQMVVNQLNETDSPYANVTFVGLILENLAPGDVVTSAVAAPFSIAITNNVFAAYYDRGSPGIVRHALLNVTMVLPNESEMAYVTYMFTLRNSPLPYLRQQTSFYTDVLHMTTLQFSPGPGSQSITVRAIESDFHRWQDVVLTTQPVVATPLPVPPRPLALSTPTRASPLVQAVHSVDDLRSFAQEAVIGDRAHILLLLFNISMVNDDNNTSANASDGGSSSAPGPIRLNSAMSWIGSSPDQGRQAGPVEPSSPAAHQVFVGCGYARSAVVIPANSSAGALQLQQLVLFQLPQGPDVAKVLATMTKGVAKEMLTLLLWSVERPLGIRALSLDGVQLLLPRPELEFLQRAASHSPDFVIELAGSGGDPLTLQLVKAVESGLHIGALQGPGILANNLSLGLDPGYDVHGDYAWVEPELPHAYDGSHSQSTWLTPVIASVCATVGVLVVLGTGYAILRRQRHALLLAASPAHSLPCSCPHHSKSELSETLPSHCSKSSTRDFGPGSVGNTPPSDPRLMVAAGVSGSYGHSTSYIILPAPAGATQGGPRGKQAPVVTPLVSDDQARGDQPPSGDSVVPLQSDRDQRGDGTRQGDALTPPSNSSLQDSIAAGMQRWRAAVSSTTMLLMERRMDAQRVASSSASSGTRSGLAMRSSTGGAVGGDGGVAGASQKKGEADRGDANALNCPPPPLQLLELLGTGSFGSVYLATWRGKTVAVKIMQLPASALFEPLDASDESQGARRRGRQGHKSNSPPHMAIMEAVLSSTLSHPNVVQVYTYYLSPLYLSSTMAAGGPSNRDSGRGNRGGGEAQPVPQGTPEPAQDGAPEIAGWTLKLVMEYCNEGSLRDALDCGLLCPRGGFIDTCIVLAFAHDVAAALLHLHSEGIVHGDLKASNVMLTSSSDPSRPLKAKVADFGLSFPLPPSDTHATMAARGTPTHMSPELFMAGHISKASDVYAYGVLLYELISCHVRAYAGVPIPLLPHAVAKDGLRPEWPASVPPAFDGLQRLAEACWSHLPQDRPTFAEILQAMELWMDGYTGWPPVPMVTGAAVSSCGGATS